MKWDESKHPRVPDGGTVTAKKRRRIKDTIRAQANRLVVTADDLQITPVRRKKPTKRRKGRAGG